MRWNAARVLLAAGILLLAGCDGGGSNDERRGGHYVVAAATYPASVVGGVERRMMVAMPSDYEELDEPLPVLYLLHGWGGSETDWTNQGRVVETLSELYASGDVVPMIVVMPNNVHQATNPLAGGPDRDLFLRELQIDIIPYVEANFPASTARSDRAIAGLSAGGIQTLNLTLFYPELWSYSFPMSTAYLPEDQARLETDLVDDLDVSAINELEEFELAIAPDDAIFYGFYQSMKQFFSETGIRYTTYEGPGAHTWAFWGPYFEVMAPKLFR